MRHGPRLDMNEGPKLGMPERALNGDLWVFLILGQNFNAMLQNFVLLPIVNINVDT